MSKLVAHGFDQTSARKMSLIVGLMKSFLPVFAQNVDTGRFEFANSASRASARVVEPQFGKVRIYLDCTAIPDKQMQALGWFLVTLAATQNTAVWLAIADFPSRAREHLDLLMTAQREWRNEFELESAEA